VTTLADFLSYRHAPGISVAILVLAFSAAALVTTPLRTLELADQCYAQTATNSPAKNLKSTALT
jgi:hypothetical protein